MDEGGQVKDDRRSRRTRRLVTAAMTELMLERPYDRITVQAILDRADIGRATFYAHFRDKADVVDAIAIEMFASVGESHATPTTPGVIPAVELFRHAKERYQSMRAMLDAPGSEIFWTQSHAAMAGEVERALAATAGRSRGAPPPDVRAQFVSGAFLGLMKWWLRAGMPYPPERMGAMFEAMARPILAPDPGATRPGGTAL
jgi:AcrR family transcriptional regulator